MTRVFALFFVGALALQSPAFGQDLDDDDARTLMSREDVAALRELIASQPSPLMAGEDLDAFYQRQRRAAHNLGDLEQVLAISRRRAAAFPDRPGARWTLWNDLAGSDRLEEANALGQELVFHDAEFTRRPALHARGSLFLAFGFMAVGRTEEAAALVKSAEEELATLALQDGRRRKAQLTDQQGFQRMHTTGMLHEARCRLFALRAMNDAALQECRLAIQVADTAIETGRRIGKRANAANRSVHERLGLAQLLLDLGRSYEAERTLREALAQAREHGVQGPCRLSEADRRFALIRLSQHRDGEALRLAGEALKLAAACNGGTLGADTRGATQILLRVLVVRSSWPEALALLDDTDRLAAGRPMLQSRVANAVPRALAYAYSGRAAQALPMITAYLERRRHTVGAQHTETALVQGVRGIVLASIDGAPRQAQARNELAAAVRVLGLPDAPGHELLEQPEQAAMARLVFERYLETLGPQPAASDVNAAFGIADLLRGSSVQRALSEAAARSAVNKPGLADIVRRDQNARNELDVLYAYLSRHADDAQENRLEAVSTQMRSRIAELEQTRSGLRAEIAQGFPEYGQLVRPAPPAPADVARQLGPSEVLVSLLPGRSHVHVWAVTRDGPVLYHRAELDPAHLASLVQRLRGTLDVADRATGRPTFDSAASRELYQRLLAPVAPALQGKAHIIVAAGDVLGQFPFGVLLTGPATDPATPPWLIRQAAVSQVPGALAWLAIKRLGRAQGAGEPLLAWGDPRFDTRDGRRPPGVSRQLQLPRQTATSADLEGAAARPALDYAQIPPLPETREELLAIAAALHADARRDVILGELATRDSVLAANRSGSLANKRVLAFATHGLMAGDLPGLDQPALALAVGDKPTDDPLGALLTLDDVLGLKLNADWVVLSACNTAAADGLAQEALSGLARGFFYAGTRSLLVTHWAVETESAKLLTTGTFDYQATHPQASKAESLRQAMLAVMALPQYAHPAFWAPYALAGDGGR